MEISAIKPSEAPISVPSPVPPAEAAERRDLIAATRSINASGLLGHNQLVFLVDRNTKRPVIRVVDRETNEIVMQLPAEYVLRLNDEIKTNSPQTSRFIVDA